MFGYAVQLTDYVGGGGTIIKYGKSFADAARILYRIERRPVLVLAVTLLLSVPLMPVELWLVKLLADSVQGWRSSDPVAPILLMAGALAVFMLLNNIGLGVPIPMAMTRLMEIGDLEEQRLLLRKTSRLPLTTLEAASTKDLREQANQVSLYGLYNTGAHIAQQFLQVLVLLIIVLVYGLWLPAAAVCAAAALLSFISGRTAERVEQLARSQTADRRLLRHYAELMTKREAAKEVRLFGLGPMLARRWTSLYEQQSRGSWAVVRAAELHKIGPELLMALLGGLLLALLVLLPGAGTLTAGDFSVLFMSLTMLLSQLTGLVKLGVTMRTQHMRWEDFRAYLALKEDAPPLGTSPSAAKPFAGIVLQAHGLTYRYPGAQRNALTEVTFTVPAGTRAAVVGENGSGKSTLVKLLTGMYTPSEGKLLWTGPTGDRLPGLGGSASAVFQDFARLSLTLRENVALGDLTALADDIKLRSSLHVVGSHHAELDVQLGAALGGTEPSGGEWQRIVTARALLRDAGFVFFDEPTAALDPQAEKMAFELFLRVTEGRTALLVTHRLGAARLADLIFVLREGRLVEQGTHEELMNRDGEYSRMFRLQASWYL